MEEELIAAVDKFLADISGQTIVDAGRVMDFGLDLRSIIKGGSHE